jgi:hypothetical protein
VRIYSALETRARFPLKNRVGVELMAFRVAKFRSASIFSAICFEARQIALFARASSGFGSGPRPTMH